MTTGAENLFNIDDAYRERGWQLLRYLFPIYRTILGQGYSQSLELIKSVIPLSILKFPSGTKCGSWTVPQEWIIRDAYISNLRGERVVDFRKNPFHVWQYPYM